ncbi:hypothetical protein [Faecalibacterium sp. An58]|uniref:hypothetical protein n=1 Tax=Faecalibacterium sp. An58 TaxID=1965648 RepID=UPI0011824BA8|nr:hypothetical protein [Faecalibacterium sp. An58]
MEMNVRMPANYNVMSEEEMTYTTGGAIDLGVFYLAGDVASWILTGVMVVNWLDMLGGARSWYAVNKTGNIGTDIENAIQTWVDYTGSSAWNAVRSIAATITAIGGTILVGGVGIPYGLIGTAAAMLTA